MKTELVVKVNKDKYDDIYRKGYDKKYPNLDLVRLERWYFKQKQGKVLDYGFGVGVNLLHMLECGHHVEGIEASPEAKRIVENKLLQRPDLKQEQTLPCLMSMQINFLIPTILLTMWSASAFFPYLKRERGLNGCCRDLI